MMSITQHMIYVVFLILRCNTLNPKGPKDLMHIKHNTSVKSSECSMEYSMQGTQYEY